MFCRVAFLGLVLLLPSLRAACGNTEQARIVWARERMYPSVSRQQLQLVYQWLQNGTSSCPDGADLWYFRSLTAQRLGNDSDARYALTKTDSSQAKAQSFDPFTPRSAARRSITPPKDKWALVVGIQDFATYRGELQHSAKDAILFGNFLSKSQHFAPDHVLTLTDKKATTVEIRKALGDLRLKAKPDDLVVVYFSSHGEPNDVAIGDKSGISYVVTHDTAKDSLYATALPMVELAEFARWMKAQQYVLLLDTCFSGAAQAVITQNPAPDAGLTPLQSLQDASNTVVIAASQANESSWEDPDNGGYFTQYLVKALQQDGGSVSLGDAFEFLKDRVRKAAEDAKQQQHPVMQSFGGGREIVMGSPAGAATALFRIPQISLRP